MNGLIKTIVIFLLGVISVFAYPIVKGEFIDPMLISDAVRDGYEEWLLPDVVAPQNNQLTSERIMLGRALFFEPRLSGNGNMSCATCHNPSLGWSDGQTTAVGHNGKRLGRATPTILNAAYNNIQMWDGRARTLEDQASGPMMNENEMHSDMSFVLQFLKGNQQYKAMFDTAYPGEEIDATTISMAIASFERTVISRNTAFDRWIRGDDTAMTVQQVRGMQIFMNPNKGNCVACHSAPNFTDDSFHALGLDSQNNPNPDLGRYNIKPIAVLKHAFKTPPLRGIANTAPYFHDGSALSLMDVVEHYVSGGKGAVSGDMKPLDLTQQEKDDLVAFMMALSEPQEVIVPTLPK